MATNIRDAQYQYSIKDHSFIFLSIIFGFIISCFLSDIFTFLKSENFCIQNDFFQILWFITLLLYILNSWWATWSEQNSIANFFDFMLFLFHAIALFFLVKLSFHEKLYGTPPSVAMIFYVLVAIGMAFIILLRKRFDSIQEESFFGKHWTRLIPIFVCTLIDVYIYQKYKTITTDDLLSIHSLFVIASAFTLGFHIYIKRNQLDPLSPGEFIVSIIQYAARDYINRRFVGFMIIDARNITKRKMTRIYKFFRKYDIWALGRDKSYYFFFNGTSSIEDKLNDKLIAEDISTDCIFLEFLKIDPNIVKRKSSYNDTLTRLFEKVYYNYYQKTGKIEKRRGITTA